MGIEKFFTVIKDGAWHSIDELSTQLDLPSSKLMEFSDFLSSQGLLKYENETRKIKIDPNWKLLLPIVATSAEPKSNVVRLHYSPRHKHRR